MISDESIHPVIHKIADLDFYTEGPAKDDKENIYCTTLNGGTILKIDHSGNISEWARSACPNGQIILANGDHLICDSKLGVIRRFDPHGKLIGDETVPSCEGEKVYSPNDLVAAPNGNIYYTDSVRDTGKICLIRDDGRHIIAASGLDYPNGIAISFGGEYLYVAESYQNRILRINLNESGIAKGDIDVFAELPAHHSGRKEDNLPDGLALDREGNVWVAHYGMGAILKISTDGTIKFSLDTSIPLTSNLFLFDTETIIITGGYGEPGPGALIKIESLVSVNMIFEKLKYLLSILLIVGGMMTTINVLSQTKPVWAALPQLPDAKGWAGMYAGVSKGLLFCMGGANFPGKLPWEGGKKKWYDDIYMLQQGGDWIKIKEKLPMPLGYGVSVSYKDTIIIIGGSNEMQHSNDVFAYAWTGKSLRLKKYPSLPSPLANMTGALINSVIVIAGGNNIPSGPAIRKCYALDLENLNNGWFELNPWPGVERSYPVSAAYKGQFYLFSGETVGTSASNEKFPEILQDAYRLTLSYTGGKWLGKWQILAPMPRGISAGASPLPVMRNGCMVFWGGVDALTRLQKDPQLFSGISNDVLLYSPEKDTWEYLGPEKAVTARVTLPVVFWNDQWVFIGGETRPGVRTNVVTTLKY